MSALKAKRNQEMFALWKGGKSIYWIAQKFKLSWPRTKQILKEEEARQKS